MALHKKVLLFAVLFAVLASACGQVRELVITPAPPSTATSPATLEPTPAVSATSTNELLPTATIVQPIPPEDIGPFRGVSSLPEELTVDGGDMRLRTPADGSVWILTSQVALRWFARAWETVLSGGEVLPVDADDEGRLWALPPGEFEIAAWHPVRQRWASAGQWMAYESASGWTGTPTSEVMSWWRPPSWRPLTQAGGILWLPVGGELRALHGSLWTTHTLEEMGFPAPVMEDVDILLTLAVRNNGSEVWVGECYYSGPGPMGGGGVRWFDGQAWQGADTPVGTTCVSAITTDPAGNVWLGAYDTIWRYDAASQVWTSSQIPEAFLSDYNFAYPQQLIVDQSGDVWVIMQLCGGASCSGPAQLYRIHNGEWSLVIESPDAFAPLKQLVLDVDGQAWLFWDGVVYRLQGDAVQSVATINARGVDLGPDGRLWVAADETGGVGLWFMLPSPQPTSTP